MPRPKARDDELNCNKQQTTKKKAEYKSRKNSLENSMKIIPFQVGKLYTKKESAGKTAKATAELSVSRLCLSQGPARISRAGKSG